jgi:putative transposase
MTSKTVSALLSDLAILRSHSRPKVSNDYPYSEAQFKTLKYCPAFPGTFGSLQDARAFCGVFFTYYNHEHRHSGIGLHTPYSVHTGTADAIQDKRQALLNACAANPRRFTRRPNAPEMPAAAWINKPVTDSDISQHPPLEAA